MTISKSFKSIKLNTEKIFEITYFLLILNQVLAQSQFNEMEHISLILKLTRWLIILILLLLILKKGKYPYNKKGLFWIVFALFSIVEMVFFNGKLLLIILFMLVIASYKTDLNKLLYTHVYALIFGLAVVILSSLVGITDTLGVYKQFDNITGFLLKKDNMRYAFGFVNSNIIPITCLYLYLYFLMIKKDRYKWFYDLFWLALNYCVYLLCGSRICILLLFFSVFLRLLVKNNESMFLKIFVPISKLLLIICVFFSLILPRSSLYKLPLIKAVDKVLTARITIMRNVLAHYPITLLGYGEIVVDNSIEYLVMDNGYIALFVMRGLVIGIAFMLILMKLLSNSKKTNNPYLLIFLMIMILANIVDNSILHYISFPIYIMAFNETVNKKQGTINE